MSGDNVDPLRCTFVFLVSRWHESQIRQRFAEMYIPVDSNGAEEIHFVRTMSPALSSCSLVRPVDFERSLLHDFLCRGGLVHVTQGGGYQYQGIGAAY